MTHDCKPGQCCAQTSCVCADNAIVNQLSTDHIPDVGKMAADEMNEWDSFVWWCNEKELNIDKYAMTMVWEYMQSMVAQERSRIATGVKSLLSAGDSSDLVWRHDVLSIIDKP